ncbi:hypothetical protein FY145_07225 [Agrobacterium tumefaciens]|uniref:Ead/Ea22-like family protein n=1 Tax=Agrobacterium tumefaciens TaxID=358 RepID=A0AAP9E359_AGRTU|nr:hypothetical protein [Agrobacterium tumefaciens]NSZ57821.1 hypothetical protein [Agrobacterium tumefaciens]QDY93940.1 hypothetical protein CG010_007225 [Agrobacterium tumefaciens]UXS49012.1 hypothetical protein FY149_17345 [Agrobacterium tumefaciens]UXS70316.1 hypothetical protein FY146_07225 [Agrobacterium tumefaciens]UXS77978.1 hypothetical protein FY145_07225 [Agrobacterium tumefaciens]
MTALEEIKKALEGVTHTPGKWEAEGTAVYCDDATGQRVCDTKGEYLFWSEDQKRNAAVYIAATNPVTISELLSTLESLQRENEEKSAWIKAATVEITKAIGGGSEMFSKHGDDFRVDPAFVATFIQFRRERHAESKKASIQKERELIARAEAAEAAVKRLNAILEPFRAVSKDWVDENGWTDVACQKDRIVDWFGPSDFRSLASTGGEHHAE